ncbi:MAG: pyruvate kinase [Actinomycetota bacterium]|nr:pyruvate kinase [Actinomycetota bacterium]
MLDGKTKIVATLGPSCRKVDILTGMIEAGMDVARINASHADASIIKVEINALRKAASAVRKDVGVILDLMGPKIRIGDIDGGEIELLEGQLLRLVTGGESGDENRISVNFAGLPAVLRSGDTVLLDDGAIRFEVVEVIDGEVLCRVETGGILRSRKGVNLPGVDTGLSALTAKDLLDLELGLEMGVDWVALSFVRGPEDIAVLRRSLDERGSALPIVAKIEKREAVSEIEGVVEKADAVMVARGDLGVEMPLEDIPLLQKRIIEVAASKGKPVITATQMLQSMIEYSSPTRAEVTDVANAVFDGTDAVMLSGETAVGRYAVKTVETMQRIILRTESSLPYRRWLEERRGWIGREVVEAVCLAACELALQTEATAIVTPTESGFTARQMSRFRPQQPILAPTPDERVARRLSLFWGVYPRGVEMHGGADDIFAAAEEVASGEGYLPPGSTVVVTAGLGKGGEGSMPTTDTIHCIKGRGT